MNWPEDFPVRTEEQSGRLARNMSAPPRSTVSFRPYGVAGTTASTPAPSEKTCGLRWLLRADPDALLKAALPDIAQRMRDLRQQALSDAPSNDKTASLKHIARVRALRLAGLVSLAADITGVESEPDTVLDEQSPEVLQDRLSDLACRLPDPPAWLPALAIAESLAGGGARNDPGSTDTLAVLWVLTRINGRTFDRNGLPHLPADLVDGGAYDLYVPCTKELP